LSGLHLAERVNRSQWSEVCLNLFSLSSGAPDIVSRQRTVQPSRKLDRGREFEDDTGEMRRLTCFLAAFVCLAGSLASTGYAVAGQDHREARREQSGGGARQQMGRVFGGGGARPQAQPAYRPQEYRPTQEYRPQEYRGDPRSDPRYSYRSQPQYAPPQQRADPRQYAPPPGAYAAEPRRGGYMGQGGPVINDYDRYRLRPPPPGYDWVQTPGRRAALVSRQTRQVFDVVPY
jgi:Ni/Co efflux regulator RcnB